jgi:hypothetical protein
MLPRKFMTGAVSICAYCLKRDANVCQLTEKSLVGVFLTSQFQVPKPFVLPGMAAFQPPQPLNSPRTFWPIARYPRIGANDDRDAHGTR